MDAATLLLLYADANTTAPMREAIAAMLVIIITQ